MADAPIENDSGTLPSVGIIGAGWLGGTVGRALAQAGYAVAFSSRHPAKHERLAAAFPDASAVDVADAMTCEVVLLATPYAVLPQFGAQYAETLVGKVVLDATNPAGTTAQEREGERRGVGQLSQSYFPQSRLVRCFSAVDATCIEQGHGYGETEPLAVPLAGDDTAALALAERLVRAVGCVPVATGALETARLFQRGQPGFRANTDPKRLRLLIGLAQPA